MEKDEGKNKVDHSIITCFHPFCARTRENARGASRATSKTRSTSAASHVLVDLEDRRIPYREAWTAPPAVMAPIIVAIAGTWSRARFYGRISI
ncbi:MAG: hypothetical protein Q6353_004615 [Candidatus Sigynarchaeum springense]